MNYRTGGAFSNAGLSLKLAFADIATKDPGIEGLLRKLFAVRYRIP